MKYTRGEWRVTTFGGNTNIEASRNGRKCWVAQSLYDEENEPTLEELTANARLMAKSPQMYELLQYQVRTGWNAGISEEAREIVKAIEGIK